MPNWTSNTNDWYLEKGIKSSKHTKDIIQKWMSQSKFYVLELE